MKIVKVLKSYYANGKVQSNEFAMKTIGDLNVLFNNAIQDAEVYAKLRGGEIAVQREKDRLYISYLGVANTQIIDKTYVLQGSYSKG